MKVINVILILSFIIGCQDRVQRNQTELSTFNLDKISYSGVLNLSELNVVDIKYVPLETTDASSFHGINKLIVSDSNIYINDYQQIFLIFRNDGSFKNSFNRQGRGPEEYVNSMDFTVDYNNQNLYVLSSAEKKIYAYTNQGKFLTHFIIKCCRLCN